MFVLQLPHWGADWAKHCEAFVLGAANISGSGDPHIGDIKVPLTGKHAPCKKCTSKLLQSVQKCACSDHRGKKTRGKGKQVNVGLPLEATLIVCLIHVGIPEMKNAQQQFTQFEGLMMA